MTEPYPTLVDVEAAAARIAPMIEHTALVASAELSRIAGHDVHLKLENTQATGSFKLRGAASFLMALDEEGRARGVVAVSSGNHGRAVAHVAARLGISATIYLTSRVPDVKVDAIRQLAAEIVIAGDSQDAAERGARAHVERTGAVMVHPYDDPLVIAGQGTIALELAEAGLDLAAIIVPLSGGGLISGIAVAAKALDSGLRIIGASQAGGAAMHESLGAGAIVDVMEEDTLADALAGGLAVPNRYTFEMCRRFVDQTVLVSEREIAAAMEFLAGEHRLHVEGGGAVGVAAVLAHRIEPTGPTAIIVSGGNVSMPVLNSIIDAGPA